MTREDIIKMARQVRDGGHWSQLDLINFANLVAAAEREACAVRAGIALLGVDRELANRVDQSIRGREKK